jgi:hypothetical protein
MSDAPQDEGPEVVVAIAAIDTLAVEYSRRAQVSPCVHCGRLLNLFSNALTNYQAGLSLVYIASRAQLPARNEENARVIDKMMYLLRRPWAGGDYPNYQSFYAARLKHHLFLDVWAAFEDQLRHVDRFLNSRSATPGKPLEPFSSVLSRLQKGAMDKVVERAERKRYSSLIDFMNDVRNTIHSNARYHGPNKKFELQGAWLQLSDGEQTNFLSHTSLLQIIPALVDAYVYLHPNHGSGAPVSSAG